MLIEVGGLVLIIVAGLGHGTDVVTRLPEIWPSAGDTTAWIGIAGTALTAVFAFIGFEHLVNVAEEMKEPSSYPAARIVPDAGLDRAYLRTGCVDCGDSGASPKSSPALRRPLRLSTNGSRACRSLP